MVAPIIDHSPPNPPAKYVVAQLNTDETPHRVANKSTPSQPVDLNRGNLSIAWSLGPNKQSAAPAQTLIDQLNPGFRPRSHHPA